MIPKESGDLYERIGRVHDAYVRLGAQITELQLSPEAEYELRRLKKTRHLSSFDAEGIHLPIRVDKKMWGVDAFKVKTASGHISPQEAIARFGATRSRLKDF